jgi:endonuclease YncB( thermonuclease family)
MMWQNRGAYVAAMVMTAAIAGHEALGTEICGVPSSIDADTFIIGSTKFRLDGIDAPEPNQKCLDEAGRLWDCGAEAAKTLSHRIGGRTVCCEDKGPDWRYQDRRIGFCRVDATNLHHWMVREGWAIDFMPYSCERFKADEIDAQQRRRGIWNGCFIDPQAFRYSEIDAPLRGSKCPADALKQLLDLDALGPGGCLIKGKIHRVVEILTKGKYHTPGCASYRATKIDPKRGDQWFCTEAEAQAAGFRKTANCKRKDAPPKTAVRCG